MAADSPAGLEPEVLDPTGEATLELFRRLDAYTALIWEQLERLSPRRVEGRLLEVGCGIGNLTRILLSLPRVTFLQAIDIDPAYVKRVEEEIRDPRLRAAACAAEDYCPAEHRPAAAEPSALPGSSGAPEGSAHDRGFDVIVSSNVLEHIDDHATVLGNFREMLRPGGVVLILVPAHPFLYSNLDRRLSHFRRYRRRDIQDVAAAARLEVLRMRHFNPIGAIGWWVSGKLLRRRALSAGQLGLYTRFALPLSRLADRLNPFPFGVSLICALGPSLRPRPALISA